MLALFFDGTMSIKCESYVSKYFLIDSESMIMQVH